MERFIFLRIVVSRFGKNYNYEFGLSLCKIVRSSVILVLPLLSIRLKVTPVEHKMGFD
jgi:hypothetical protein